MVKLRLMRMGKKKQPFYRVVAADSRSPRNGRFIEIVGTYDSRQHPSIIKIDNDKAVKWLRQGAQPTERVEKLLRISGAWDDFKGLAEGTSVPPVVSAPAPAAKAPDAVVAPIEESPAVEVPVEEELPTEGPSSDDESAPEPAASTDTDETEEA